MSKESFTVAVPDEVLADLRERLAKVRWPGDFANAPAPVRSTRARTSCRDGSREP